LSAIGQLIAEPAVNSRRVLDDHRIARHHLARNDWRIERALM
jgi:hypothetical protein